MRKIITQTLIVISLASIIALGTPLDAQARPDDVNPPDFFTDPNSLLVFWQDGDVIFTDDGCDEPGLIPGGLALFDFQEFPDGFPLQVDPPSFVSNSDGTNTNFDFFMPNYIDPLKNKDIRIQVTWCGPSEPTITGIDAEDSDAGIVSGVLVEHVDDAAFTPGADYFYEDWIVRPNPDLEHIFISIPVDSFIIQVIIDTVSFDIQVGGKLLPLDTTALLLAGAQSSLIWILPVVLAGIGLASYKLKKK